MAGRVVGALAAVALVLSAADIGPFDLVGGPAAAGRTARGDRAAAAGHDADRRTEAADRAQRRGLGAARGPRRRREVRGGRDGAGPREPAGATRLYFAGRLPDGSRLVMVGSDVMPGMVATAVHALRVAPAVGGRARVTEGAALSDSQQVLAWAGPGAEGSVVAVALARPGPVRFGFSPRVTFTDDGSARRSWQLAYAPDGSTVVDLGDTDPLVAVRAQAPGVFGRPMLVRVETEPPAPARARGRGHRRPGLPRPGPGPARRRCAPVPGPWSTSTRRPPR